MFDIRKCKIESYIFLLISVLFLFYCSPPTDPGTLPPSNLKFDKTDFFAYVGDDVMIKPTVSNRVDEFTIVPALPAGLAIDPITGVISGIASEVIDSTTYTMFATNKNGSVKEEFSLTVSAYPSFVIQPQTQTATIGGSVTFAVSAKGNEPLTYNWTKDDIALPDTGKTLTLVDIKEASAGLYRCVVKDRRGKTVSSDPAYCRIEEIESAPKIILAPGSRSAIEGESVILVSSATGSNLEFKWLFNGVVIPGVATSYLPIDSVNMADTGNYVVIVSNKFGADTSKPAAHLSVIAKTSIYFSFDIAIIGNGSVVINEQKFVKDTTLEFPEGTTFTAALLADSAYILSSVIVDNSLDIDAVSNKQYQVSSINQNHSINVSFTKETGTTPDSLFLLQCMVSPSGSGSVSKSDTILNVTDSLPLTAVPNVTNGYEFKTWRQTGGTGLLYISDSTSAIANVSVSKGPVTLTAVFTLREYSVSVNCDSTKGSITIRPDTLVYFYGDSITVTAQPNFGYTFTSWTGDLTGTATTQTVVITKSMTFNAEFVVDDKIQEVPVAAGGSLNAEIKKISALSIPGAILTPAAGLYDNNALEILGKVTIPIQRR
ncbi:MAG: hypothetical protein GX639_20940 [Fibrobacter sp.]|nr:hypothetical protein [Fibrobacter sp.]